MRRVPTGPGEGWKIQSNRGWFFLGVAGRIYAFHLEVGRLSISVEARHEAVLTRRARRNAE